MSAHNVDSALCQRGDVALRRVSRLCGFVASEAVLVQFERAALGSSAFLRDHVLSAFAFHDGLAIGSACRRPLCFCSAGRAFRYAALGQRAGRRGRRRGGCRRRRGGSRRRRGGRPGCTAVAVAASTDDDESNPPRAQVRPRHGGRLEQRTPCANATCDTLQRCVRRAPADRGRPARENQPARRPPASLLHFNVSSAVWISVSFRSNLRFPSALRV